MASTPESNGEKRTTAYKKSSEGILPLQPSTEAENSTKPASKKKTPAAPKETAEETLKKRFLEAANATKRISSGVSAEPVTLDRMSVVDDSAQTAMLEQLRAAAAEQTEKKSDHTVEQGVSALQTAEQDAAADFQSRRDKIDADELKALDNQSLYASARGDRGGIGRAQYDAVQNAAAANRLAVDREQQKLATDTARNIAALRAQGEFEKADKLLSLTQSYLSELMSLKRWAAETNMDVEEFNSKLAQWEADYALAARRAAVETELEAAKVTGALSDGTPTESALDSYREQLAAAGRAMLNRGLTPTAAQLEAMGWTQEQYKSYVKARANAASAAENAKLTGPIYIRGDDGQLKQVTKREYREYLAEKAR